jgi:outer membrane protein TolC
MTSPSPASPTPTQLDPPDYWQLRALSADLDREQTALALVQTRLEALRTRREALWKTLVEKYGLDPTAPYAARDEDCSLTPSSPGGPS